MFLCHQGGLVALWYGKTGNYLKISSLVCPFLYCWDGVSHIYDMKHKPTSIKS